MTSGKITKETEKFQEVIIGMDVHKKQWNITIIADGKIRKPVTMDPKSKTLSKYVKKQYPSERYVAGYEAGYSGFWICWQLEEEGIETIVINAADVPTTDKESRRKNDNVDSLKIARAIKAGTVSSIDVPTPEQQSSRAILRKRKDTVKILASTKNKIKAFLAYHGIQEPEPLRHQKCWSGNYVNWLKQVCDSQLKWLGTALKMYIEELEFFRKQKLAADRLVRQMSRQEEFKEISEVLMTVPGVGQTVSMTLLTEVGDIFRFKCFDRLSSLLAMTPTEHSSGEHQRYGHMTKRGKLYIRSLLVEAAWVAIRSDGELYEYYVKKKESDGAQKAIVSTAKKLLSRIYHIWRKRERYVITKKRVA